MYVFKKRNPGKSEHSHTGFCTQIAEHTRARSLSPSLCARVGSQPRSLGDLLALGGGAKLPSIAQHWGRRGKENHTHAPDKPGPGQKGRRKKKKEQDSTQKRAPSSLRTPQWVFTGGQRSAPPTTALVIKGQQHVCLERGMWRAGK